MMTTRDYNPFTQMELRLPSAYREQVSRFSRTREAAVGGSKPQDSPFPRYVDLWMASVCVGAAEGAPIDLPLKLDTWRFEYGARLQGATVWIDLLQLLAIAHFGEARVVDDSRRVIDLANAYAAAGLPKVMDMMTQGHQGPLWDLTLAMMNLVDDNLPALPEQETELAGG
jgi:hypothetical protein